MTWEKAPDELGRRHRRRWYANQLRRQEIETEEMTQAAVAAAMLGDLIAPSAVELPEQAPETPAKRGRIRRGLAWLWARRIAIFAVLLSLTIEVTIVATQVPYYAQLPGMAPTLAGVLFRVYWMMPVITGGLTLYYGAAAAFVVDKRSGHYTRYLRLMWFFASIGALVNVTHSLHLLGDQDWITAVVLGGGSLASPLVLHSWTGLRIATTVSGYSLQDLMVTGRRWIRHPKLSLQFAYRVDLFPELDPADVWEMTVRTTRAKVINKVNRRVDEPGQTTVGRTRKGRRGSGEVHSEVHTGPDVNPAVNSVNSLPLPAETPMETTAERELKTTLVAAYFLNKEGVHPQRTQKFISEAAGASQSYTSRVFTECKRHEHGRPDDLVMTEVAAHFAQVSAQLSEATGP